MTVPTLLPAVQPAVQPGAQPAAQSAAQPNPSVGAGAGDDFSAVLAAFTGTAPLLPGDPTGRPAAGQAGSPADDPAGSAAGDPAAPAPTPPHQPRRGRTEQGESGCAHALPQPLAATLDATLPGVAGPLASPPAPARPTTGAAPHGADVAATVGAATARATTTVPAASTPASAASAAPVATATAGAPPDTAPSAASPHRAAPPDAPQPTGAPDRPTTAHAQPADRQPADRQPADPGRQQPLPQPALAPAVAPAVPTAATPPPPPTAPAASVAHPQPQLTDAVARLRTRGSATTEIAVALHPAELGAVHVRAVLHGDSLTVTVACADDAARQAVTAALPDLHHALGGLGSIDVDLRNGAHDQQRPAEPDQRERRDPSGSPSDYRENQQHRPRSRADRNSDDGLDRWM